MKEAHGFNGLRLSARYWSAERTARLHPQQGEIGYGVETGKSSKTVGNNIDFNIGTKQELFYLQAGGSFFEDRGQQLSFKFNMLINDDEDGGRRDNSVQRDKKFNFKISFTL